MVTGWFIAALSFLLAGLLAVGIKSFALYLAKKTKLAENLITSKFERNKKIIKGLKLKMLAGDCDLIAFIFCRVGMLSGLVASLMVVITLVSKR